MAKQSDQAKKWAEIVAKAWMDEKFKQKLMHNPKEVLEECGLDVPSAMSLKVSEDTHNQRFLILPEKPKGHFSETELKKLLEEQMYVGVFVPDKKLINSYV